MRLFIFTAAGSCIADIVYEGSSGSIILDGYENDQYNTWQINSDCESLLFESTVFDTDIYDLLNFDEEGSERVKHSGDAKFVHTTNTGILTLSFASDFMGNSHDGFNINWRCSESNESDAPNLGCPDQFTELSAESCYRSQDGINSHSQAYSACVAMDAKLATIMIADSLIITGVSPIWVDDDINFMIACVEFVADEMKVGACDGAVGTVCVKDKIIVEEVDESDGSDESNVHEGSSGSISLNGYENNKNLYWQINSDCESIHFKSTVFDTDWDDFFYIDEEGSKQFELYGDDYQLSHTTNTGNVQVSFVPDGNKHNDGVGFEIDWQCAESNESDVETWSSWDGWSESCSVTCGTGQQTRSRQCSGSPGFGECEGPETDVRLCDKEQCEPICWANNKIKFWNGAGFGGNDLQRLTVATLENCMDLCLARVDCTAFTFRSTDMQCWLKSKSGEVVRMGIEGLVSGMRCAHKPDLQPPGMADGRYPETGQSPKEIATGETACPSSDCWTFNPTTSECEIITTADCFELKCYFDRMIITFDYGLFGVSSEKPELDDFSPAKPTHEIANDTPFTLDCEFDECDITAKVESAEIDGESKTLNLKTTIIKAGTGNPKDLILPDGVQLTRKKKEASITFECVYKTEIALDAASFDVKQAAVSGLVSEIGELKAGFTMVISGSDYIGGIQSALITWEQGNKLKNIQFLAKTCTITHGDMNVLLIADTCISRGLLGQSTALTDWHTMINFTWMSFLLVGQDDKTQTLACEIVICEKDATDCERKSTCPTEDGYNYQQFKTYD